MKTALWSETYFQKLGEVLHQQGITGEILLTKRTMLLLDIHHREVSKDVDVSFGPGEALREGARLIAEQEDLPPQWLELAIESRFPERTSSDGATYPGLHIYVAPPGYALTMFLLFGNQIGVDDEILHDLASQLGLSTSAEMFSLLKAYLPEQAIPSQVQGKIEQTFAA